VFRQATSREAAYAMLVEEDKRLAHARAAEHLAGSRGDPVAIAEHHERAQAPERAAPWWAKAATQALEANDFTGAIARAEAAERCGARGDDLVEALLARVEAHSWRNENPALRATAERLGAVATTIDEEAAALRWMALGALRAGDTPELGRVLGRVLERAGRHGVGDTFVFSALRIATIALGAGFVSSADALASTLEAVEPPLETRCARILGARARWRVVRAHHDHDIERTVALRLEAAQLLRSGGDTRTAAAEDSSRGYELALLGAYEEALQSLEATLAECRRLGLAFAIVATQHNLGFVLLGLGRLEDALRVERQALAAFTAGGNMLMDAACRDYLARILVAAGRAEEAVAEAGAAVGALPAEHPYALSARASLAQALLARRAPGDAASAMTHARAVYDALREDPARFQEPAFILRVHLEALDANAPADEARQAREEARGWVLERAGQIRSEHYRRTFLEGALDVARILKCPSGPGAA
jgi:tetratricopeptide (TPR) repeat protein